MLGNFICDIFLNISATKAIWITQTLQKFLFIKGYFSELELTSAYITIAQFCLLKAPSYIILLMMHEIKAKRTQHR